MMDETPLHYACRHGNLNIAQYLIREEHCNPSCENNDGYTPLHFACSSGHLNIAQYLIREELLVIHSCKDNDGRDTTFTMLVAMVTSTLPSTSSERNTVIHHVRTIMAIHHFTMLVLMVTSTLPSTSSERNTVIHHVRTMMFETPLHYACRHGNLNIAQYLIREEQL